MSRSRAVIRRGIQGEALETLLVRHPNLFAMLPMRFDCCKLRQCQRRRHIRHVVLETRIDYFVAAGTANKTTPGSGGHAVQREHLYALMQLAITRDDHSPVTGGNVFGGIKAETAGVAHQAGGTLLIGCLDGVGAIFNYAKPVPPGDTEDGIHVAAAATHVNYENRLGTRSDSFFDERGIDVEGAPVAIHQHRLRSGMHDGVYGGAESHGGSDDFITRTNPASQQGKMDGGGTAADGSRVGRALVAREFLLELFDPGAQTDPITPQAVNHGGDLGFANY